MITQVSLSNPSNPTTPLPRWLNKVGVTLLTLGFLTPVVIFSWAEHRVRLPFSQPLAETWTDTLGRPHVLGITLGSTRLREAEIILRSRSDIALYHYRDKPLDLVLEANFPSLPDHSRVVLSLAADTETLTGLSRRASVPRLYPNDMVRLNLATTDLATVQNLTVVSLRLYPSADISEAVLRSRFGEPSQAQYVNKETTQYSYPALHLVARLNDYDLDELSFATLMTAQ